MTPDRRRCRSCGATAGDAAFPPDGRAAGAPMLCLDCADESHAPPPDVRAPMAPVITRASYRAALRVRAASPQGDLVDLLVPAP